MSCCCYFFFSSARCLAPAVVAIAHAMNIFSKLVFEIRYACIRRAKLIQNASSYFTFKLYAHTVCVNMVHCCRTAKPDDLPTKTKRVKKSITAHKNARLKTIRKSELNKMNERPTNRPTDRTNEGITR